METPSREASDAGSATRRNPRGLGMSPGRGVYSFLDDLSPEAKREATIEDRAALLQLTKFRERLAAMGDACGGGRGRRRGGGIGRWVRRGAPAHPDALVASAHVQRRGVLAKVVL